MYSRRIVLEKLARFKAHYGWTPVPHSIEQIDEINAYMQTLYKREKNGDLVFDDAQMTPRLKRWIQNERAMVALDCEYYLTRYHYIAAENRVFRFAFRIGQKVLFDVLAELEEKNQAIEIQLLKARQGGYSTMIEGLMTHRALFQPGVKASVASADPQKTYVMMTMMYTAMENLPWWLPPRQTKDKRSGAAILEFAHVGSQIVIQSGSGRGGLGQGTTPTAIHLSEVSQFTDPLAQIEEGLFKAVHSGPEILMILESTGEGDSGWWAEQWRTNKEFYFQGRSRLYPLFIPWFMTPELYPKKQWIEKYPVPESWTANERTRATVAKCETYAHHTIALTKALGPNWKMPRDQQWFWEFNFEDALRRNTEKSWLRHMPCDDFDALTGDSDPIFGRETLIEIDNRRVKEIKAYGIIGEGIAEKHEPLVESVQYKGSRIIVPWETPHGIKLQWMFLPIAGNPEDKTYEPLKRLLVYEEPQPNCQYSIGVDTGYGVGGDRTIISVNRFGSEIMPDVQCAEFSSDDITNVEVYAWCMAIAAWYGKYMEEGQTPRFVIEQRRKYGDSCYHALKLHGFTKHHHFRDYDKKTLRPRPSVNPREGWYTNEWSRPLLLSTFQHAVEGGWYQVNSRWLKQEIEMQQLKTTDSGKVRADHRQGQHDDRIFSAAMAYITFHDSDLMAERAKARWNHDDESGPEIDYAPWRQTVSNTAAEDFLSRFG